MQSLVLVPCTATLGYFASQFIIFGLEDVLSPEAMNAWGWRLPFLAALPPGLLAVCGRRCLQESPSFQQDVAPWSG